MNDEKNRFLSEIKVLRKWMKESVWWVCFVTFFTVSLRRFGLRTGAIFFSFVGVLATISSEEKGGFSSIVPLILLLPFNWASATLSLSLSLSNGVDLSRILKEERMKRRFKFLKSPITYLLFQRSYVDESSYATATCLRIASLIRDKGKMQVQLESTKISVPWFLDGSIKKVGPFMDDELHS